ncbi:glutathione S-transferase [Melanogaster broomeanus]|nr:glutathione S-transferase [Melanogaster broomeanus]
MSVPDEQIHPVATSRAAETVAQHQSPQDLVFWSGWFCPFNQRVWITLEEKGIPYQYKEVNPYKKEKYFLDRRRQSSTPRAWSPRSSTRGRALYESIVLCEFLEEAYGAHTPSLLPADAYERARVRIWIDHASKTIVPASHRLLMAQGKEKEDAARQELYDAEKKLAEEVKGPYFLGEEFSLLDVIIAPWAARKYILVEHRGQMEGISGELSARESVIKTSSDTDKLQVIYDRYLRDEAQSEAAKAIRAGRPLP